MSRIAMLALLATLGWTTDAGAIEMFTFYGSGEHYAGYPNGGQHYARFAGMGGDYYAGTPYMGYGVDRHGHGACGCSTGHRGHGHDCAHVWDGFCQEKCHPKWHRGHLRCLVRGWLEKHRCRKHRCNAGCDTCGHEPCGCEGDVNYGVDSYYGEPQEAVPTEAEPMHPEEEPAPAPGPSVRRSEIWPKASALFPSRQKS